MNIGGPPEMYTYPPPEPAYNWNDLYRLETFSDKRGDHRWRVRSAMNGKIVANCGQGYSNYDDMMDVAQKLFPQADPVSE